MDGRSAGLRPDRMPGFVARDLRHQRSMAAKVRLFRLLQEIRGLAEISNRRPQSRTPGFFLMQMRSHVVHTTSPGCRRSIAIALQDLPDIPHPVKITHVKAASTPPAPAPVR